MEDAGREENRLETQAKTEAVKAAESLNVDISNLQASLTKLQVRFSMFPISVDFSSLPLNEWM